MLISQADAASELGEIRLADSPRRVNRGNPAQLRSFCAVCCGAAMALIPHAGQAGRPSDRGLGALQVIRASDRDAILIVATGAQALDRIAKLWDLPPTGNRVEFEFIDIFRVSDDKLI